jgi:hypothetical protein
MIILAIRSKRNVGQKMNGHTSNFKSWNLLWDLKYGLVMHDVGELVFLTNAISHLFKNGHHVLNQILKFDESHPNSKKWISWSWFEFKFEFV